VELLVALGDGAVLEPDGGVLEFLAAFGWLVDSDVDGDLRFFARRQEALDEDALIYGLGQGDGFRGGGGDIVGRFGKEEGLYA
jgi:hypothetical protein